MRIIPKLYLSLGLLLAIAVGGTSLAVICAREGAEHTVRTNQAHQAYEAYLLLANHTYRLFKQFGDALLIGDRDRGAGETELLARIRASIARIRRITVEEIRLAGEEEVEELEHLERIESKIEDLLIEFEQVSSSWNPKDLPNYWTRLSRMLDETIDKDFSTLIEDAIDGEAAEVAAERAESMDMIKRFQILAAAFSLVALAAAGLSIWILRRDIRQPIVKLEAGASALARGDLEHRIDVDGRNELHEVALAFNGMAEEVSRRQKTLTDSNVRLEKAVSERTAELERLLAALRESDANRRRLLADVSHELRTPLTVIHGEATVALRDERLTAAQYRVTLDHIREAAMHTANLVDDLLFVARREAGEVRLDVRTVDLGKLLSVVVEQYSVIAHQHRATVNFVGDVDKALVPADAGRIRQLVLILLENAIRYGGGWIEIRLGRSPDGFAVSVSDDGPGMAEDEQQHAFERFFRGSNAAARYHEGSGLGLPMARAIVEAHGGDIALKSIPGEGLTVSFTLPGRAKLEAVA